MVGLVRHIFLHRLPSIKQQMTLPNNLRVNPAKTKDVESYIYASFDKEHKVDLGKSELQILNSSFSNLVKQKHDLPSNLV